MSFFNFRSCINHYYIVRRLLDYNNQDQSARDYLAACALCFGRPLLGKTNIFAVTQEGIALPHVHGNIRIHILEKSCFRSYRAEFWRLHTRDLGRLARGEKPEHPTILEVPIIEKGRETRYISAASLPSSEKHVWLFPARISGTLSNGTPFGYTHATAFAQECARGPVELRNLSRFENRLIPLQPKAPKLDS